MADTTLTFSEPLAIQLSRRLAGVRPYILVGQVYVAVALLFTFGAVQGQLNVQVWYFVLIGMFGLAVPFLAPRDAVRHTFVSIPLLLLYAYLVCSIAWVSGLMPYRAAFQQQVPIVVATTFVASLVPFPRLVQGLKAGFILGILFSFFAVATDASARVHNLGDGTMFSGWRGSFEHKNALVPFVVFAVITFMFFEQRRWLRYSVLAASLILTIGTQSSTGLSCVIVVGCAAWWFNSYLKQDLRLSGSYVALSFFGAIAVGIAITVLLPFIVNLYGKDLTFSNRTDIWEATVPVIGEQPIQGYGWNGAWIEPDVEPTVSLNRNIGFDAGHAHNAVLEMLLQGGIIGLALYLVFFGSVAVAGWRALRTHPDLGRWVLLFLVAQVVMGFSEVTLFFGWMFTLVLMRCVLARQLSTTSRSTI
jgi:O-antigen ligase